ncbi:MAG: SurA N-terminal domain-containing protein, partial [Janthinobacterium lividum]
MITFFRKFLTSWFALGLLGLLLVAFAFSGIGTNPFGGAGGGGVAHVGGTELTEARLLSEFDRVLDRARQSDPKLTAPDAARQGAVGEVLEQLIATTALEDFGKRIGVSVSDRAVDGEIASVDAFRVNGRFDQATYRRLLAQQRITERDLRDGLHGDLVRKQIVTPVVAGAQVPRSMAAPYAAVLLEKRDGAVAIVPVAAMPVPAAPTDAQLANFYAVSSGRYTIPERRSFRYALLDHDKLAAAVAVTDADVAKYYAANRETYGGVEQRRLTQVVVPDQARADALVAAVKGGKSFAAAAAAAGFSASDIDIGRQSQAKFAAATSPAVAAAAFAVAAGGITAPVKSPFGWHVVAVTAIEPAKPRGLADARAEILAKLHDERSAQLVSDTVGKIEDALGGGTSFADVAKTYGLTIVGAPALTRDGRDPDDAGYTVSPAVLPLVGKAFDSDPADGASIQDLGHGQFAVLELKDIVPPAPVPLAKVRAAVVAAWTDSQREREARTVADAIVAEVARGKPLGDVLAAHKLAPAQSLSGRRLDFAQKQVAPPVQAFLTLGVGGTRVVAAP